MLWGLHALFSVVLYLRVPRYCFQYLQDPSEKSLFSLPICSPVLGCMTGISPASGKVYRFVRYVSKYAFDTDAQVPYSIHTYIHTYTPTYAVERQPDTASALLMCTCIRVVPLATACQVDQPEVCMIAPSYTTAIVECLTAGAAHDSIQVDRASETVRPPRSPSRVDQSHVPALSFTDCVHPVQYI
ncbi:hypothetical protein BDV59DRAFT_88395 [Aspergillus ambiguus]|uniref:uncharacterized protein n=1 Tax=Aspergillus ambiguus TaxID=176160 RepID=UPI003CCDA575